MLKKLTIAYFSPTGNTKRAALCFGASLCQHPQELDLSLPSIDPMVFQENEVLLVAAPVFAGRIPLVVLEKLKALTSRGALAITATVYGNRAYDDALLELNDFMIGQRFQVVASGAFVAQHSISHNVAVGRPDAQDLVELNGFGENILDKLVHTGGLPVSQVPGKRPYIQRRPASTVPMVSHTCIKCGICAQKCPVQAISIENPTITNPEKCIQCMRCTVVCPHEARSLLPAVQAMTDERLSPYRMIRNKNEFFL